MHKLILSLSVWFACLTCLTACQTHDDDDDDNVPPSGEYTPPTVASRTVLIYMAGENDLTYPYGLLNDDLREIVRGSAQLDDNQRLFVFVDSLDKNGAAPVKPYIMEMHGGKSYMRHQYDEEFYSSDPANFQDVVQRVVEMSPSDSYGLVLWGHASGWAVWPDPEAAARIATRAYGRDDGKDEGQEDGVRWMNIKDMVAALEGLPKFEFIFADCCNMMCAEVGYEMRNTTKYLIGSPAEIPGYGAPYDIILPDFYKDDADLYYSIIDDYYDSYLRYYQNYSDLKGYSVPMSVIDTRQMEKLAEETRDVLEKYIGGYPQYPQHPNLTADSVAFYWYFDAPVMYDMRAFIKCHTEDDDFRQWDLAFQQAVPYYRMSLRWETIYINGLKSKFRTFSKDTQRYGCVSMFIPQNTTSYFNGTYRFNATANEYGWNRIIDWGRFGWTDDVIYK